MTKNEAKFNAFPLAFIKWYKDENSKCFRDFQFVVWWAVCFLLLNFIKSYEIIGQSKKMSLFFPSGFGIYVSVLFSLTLQGGLLLYWG